MKPSVPTLCRAVADATGATAMHPTVPADPYAAAESLIAKHGRNAHQVARRRGMQSSVDGDEAAGVAWRRVADAVAELTRTVPRRRPGRWNLSSRPG